MRKKQHRPLLLVQPNQLTLVVGSLKVKVQASVHERLAAVRAVEDIAGIPGIGIQALHLEWRRRRLDGCMLLVGKHERLVFLLADELHRRPVGVVGQTQAVEATCDDDGVDLLPVSEDARNGRSLFSGKLVWVELETEGSTLERKLTLCAAMTSN